MREINFRGLGVDNHWWFGESKPLGEYRHYNLAIFFLKVYAGSIRPETVGEWTGLHDKNGKEIYEGDILKGERLDYFNPKVDTVIVEWLECGAWYPFANDQDEMPYPKSKDVEVIGNIWEHSFSLNK